MVIAAFSAWKVTVFSFECGGPTYWVGPETTVMSADCARSRWELRVSDRALTDAVGNDTDRVEFRYRDANNKMDFKCSRTSVPGSWLPHLKANVDQHDDQCGSTAEGSGRRARADRAVRSVGCSSRALVSLGRDAGSGQNRMQSHVRGEA